MSKKILIVDDEPDILEFLRYNLEANGYIVETALNGEQCLKKIENFQPSLVILDIMMPRMNGVETCEKIKANKNLKDILVVFLSARNEEFTQLACYDAGGEDFIPKPIQPKLLIKKIESILKRVYRHDTPAILNGIQIDYDKYKVIADNQEIQFTKTQFEVFSLLYSKPDHVFSRERIISKIWGTDYYVSTRNLDVQIRKIREKIGNKKIGTIKGVGYKFCSS